MEYVHCDVFAARPFTGNSLAVFPDRQDLSAAQMLAITRELRHFESIFLRGNLNEGRFSARIFDLIEEMPFAGHPIIGAACVLHSLRNDRTNEMHEWTFDMKEKAVTVSTTRSSSGYRAALDQGRPDFITTLSSDDRKGEFARAFNLAITDLASTVPLEVISTGLKYLIIPIVSRIEEARIVRPDLAALLNSVEAEYAYLFDIERFEGRHWNNDGVVEDVATGSAAGAVGAFALRHGLAGDGLSFTLKQGRFVGRPSEINVTALGSSENVGRVVVAGDVSFVGRGVLGALPTTGE